MDLSLSQMADIYISFIFLCFCSLACHANLYGPCMVLGRGDSFVQSWLMLQPYSVFVCTSCVSVVGRDVFCFLAQISNIKGEITNV